MLVYLASRFLIGCSQGWKFACRWEQWLTLGQNTSELASAVWDSGGPRSELELPRCFILLIFINAFIFWFSLNNYQVWGLGMPVQFLAAGMTKGITNIIWNSFGHSCLPKKCLNFLALKSSSKTKKKKPLTYASLSSHHRLSRNDVYGTTSVPVDQGLVNLWTHQSGKSLTILREMLKDNTKNLQKMIFKASE